MVAREVTHSGRRQFLPSGPGPCFDLVVRSVAATALARWLCTQFHVWHQKCMERFDQGFEWSCDVSKKSKVRSMFRAANGSEPLPVPGFPEGVDVRWETQRRIVWNERERANEEYELVYETSWIAELGLWRSFLRSHRKMER